MKFFLALFALFFVELSFSQSLVTLSGTINDAANGEELIGATVQVKEQAGIGAVTNAYGFYSLSLAKGKYTFLFRYIGYQDIVKEIVLDSSQTLHIQLPHSQKELKQVEISETRNENLTTAQMGATKIDMVEIAKIPVIFGERDVLKTIQLLPGVQPAGEGSSGFYVRGGSTDQNLILLDEATVYNASHLLGFFSTFNSDAVKDVTLYKGNNPAEFGGRLSSVVDVKMKDGNDKCYNISGGIGLISSRLNVEGPIKKDQGSFMISARRTYADLFLKLLPKSNQAHGSVLYFYDVNAKANYRITKRDRIFLSGYFGRDKMGLKNSNLNFSLDYGNITGTLRWNHVFSDKLFSNTTFIVNDFDYTVGINIANTDFKIRSVIFDYNLKQDYQYYINSKHTLKFGFLSTFHTIQPGSITSGDTATMNSQAVIKKYGWENGIYAQHEWNPIKQIHINYGLRLSTFSVTGPSNSYSYDAGGNAVDSTHYNLGQFGKTYVYLEPRFTLSYNFLSDHSFKLAYSRNTQNLHLLSNSSIGSPTDLWIMSSNNVKSEIADQVSLGYYFNFNLLKSQFEFSIEGYFKYLQNQIDYKNGAQIRANENVESELVSGIGRAYGAEFFLKKKTGKLTGWISYTLSRTERRFTSIN
ncbi:MAG TPA: TonB-dependent receptor, partial [Chitinophagales bacterium]